MRLFVNRTNRIFVTRYLYRFKEEILNYLNRGLLTLCYLLVLKYKLTIFIIFSALLLCYYISDNTISIFYCSYGDKYIVILPCYSEINY